MEILLIIWVLIAPILTGALANMLSWRADAWLARQRKAESNKNAVDKDQELSTFRHRILVVFSASFVLFILHMSIIIVPAIGFHKINEADVQAVIMLDIAAPPIISLWTIFTRGINASQSLWVGIKAAMTAGIYVMAILSLHMVWFRLWGGLEAMIHAG